MRLTLLAGLVFAFLPYLAPAPAAPASRAAPVWKADDPDGRYVIGGIIGDEKPAKAADISAGLAKLEQSAPKVEAPDYGCDTFPVRFRGYLTNGEPRILGGSAVSLGDGRFVTAAHGVRDYRPGYVVEFEVGTQWHKGTPSRVDLDADVLEATIPKTDVSGVKVREPRYGEPITVYGLTTRKPMKGVFYGDGVGLDTSEPGVQSGDSGGGIYGSDGALLAVLSGYGKDTRSLIVSALGTKPNPPPVVQSAPAPSYSPPPGVVCRNGQCWRTAPAGVTCKNGQCFRR